VKFETLNSEGLLDQKPMDFNSASISAMAAIPLLYLSAFLPNIF
jgi:hypothetical protein|tara:strand:+ start:220 stop:351 length:132 start_codon:yes stop_codon:yes gene_type:complete